jgi:hypothetical protein
MKQHTAQEIRFPQSVPDAAGPSGGMAVGRIVRMDAEGRLSVDFPGNTRGPLAARLCGAVAEHLQSAPEPSEVPVVLLFEDNDPARPIVVDCLLERVPDVQPPLAFDIGPDNTVSVDGRIVQLNAEEQIVLKCGKASITLTRAGKVIIRGAYLLNRSSGVNRIKGGSVQIN